MQRKFKNRKKNRIAEQRHNNRTETVQEMMEPGTPFDFGYPYPLSCNNALRNIASSPAHSRQTEPFLCNRPSSLRAPIMHSMHIMALTLSSEQYYRFLNPSNSQI